MPKVQIELPNHVYNQLKQKAKKHYQSLRGYIAWYLVDTIENPKQFIDTTNVPANTKITTHSVVTKPKTEDEIEEQQLQAFKKLWHEILGADAEFDVNEHCAFLPDNDYFDFAEKEKEGKYVRWAYTMPEDKQREYITIWKHYLEK